MDFSSSGLRTFDASGSPCLEARSSPRSFCDADGYLLWKVSFFYFFFRLAAFQLTSHGVDLFYRSWRALAHNLSSFVPLEVQVTHLKLGITLETFFTQTISLELHQGFARALSASPFFNTFSFELACKTFFNFALPLNRTFYLARPHRNSRWASIQLQVPRTK